MRDDDLVVIGGLVLLVMAGRRDVPWGAPSLWTFPVPDLVLASTGKRYPAAVSQEFRPGFPSHFGVDVMYEREAAFALPAYPPPHDGSRGYFAPPTTPVCAARDGSVWSSDLSARGTEVVIDHGKPFATYYQHLSVSYVAKGQAVKAGDVIGLMGYDPIDPEGLRHLHFAVWLDGAGDGASVDPQAEMASWRRATWTL